VIVQLVPVGKGDASSTVIKPATVDVTVL
jgi:hypothetical protein